MVRYSSRLFVTFALVAFSAFAMIVIPRSHAETTVKEAGDLWEVTSQMTMEGMPMALPAQTTRVCAAKEWKEPPGPKGEEQKCSTLDFKNVGSKASWKIKCEGPPAMTGEGEITRSGSEAYTGHMKLTSAEGVMTMQLNGRRVGDCDAGETKREVAKMQARNEALVAQAQADMASIQKQQCQALVTAMDLRSLKTMSTMCKDPSLKTDFCKRLETPEGFDLVAACGSAHADGLTDEAAYCGKDEAKIAQTVCAEALQKESLDLLGRCCTVEAQGLAQKECAGRKYTEMTGSKYQAFCVNYAKGVMADGAQEPTAAQPESKTDKAKKTLKGLFKR